MATASVAIHLSEVSFRAALAALKISKTFSRQVQSPSAAYQAVLNHLDRAGLFRSLSLHVAANGEGSTEWSFGNPSELSVPSLVAAHSNSSVVVNTAAEPAPTGNTELLRMTLDYLVQKSAMFATR